LASAEMASATGFGAARSATDVTELKDKSPALTAIDLGLSTLATSVAERAAPKPVADAISALANLGYPQASAMSATAAAVKALGDGAETSALIRQGLKELAK